MEQNDLSVNRFGLTQVAKPKGNTATALHIVFVHGLRGDPKRTWLKKPATFWPQTLLPAQFPEANIYTYGYDADVEKLSSWMSSGRNSIHQHARNLTTDLANLIDAMDQARPSFIFIAHSLGGIVVKDALNQSSHADQEHQRRVVSSTIGVCFMGTPHRGSSAANLARHLLPVSYIFFKRPNWRVVSSLEPESEKLDSVADAFAQTIKRHDIDIYTFYEERAYGLGLASKVLVDANSAKIGDIREEIASIPADHKEMVRYSSTSDVGYQRLSAALSRCEKRGKEAQHGPTEDFEDCQASLQNLILRMRLENIAEPHDKTFHWLYDATKVDFHSWLVADAEHSPIYWIQGKPGSGKSTLMKFAMFDKRTLQALSQTSSEPWSLVGFFFHDRGIAAQKSLQGMLHELLYQILLKVPALFVCIQHLFKHLSREQRSRTPAWDVATLRKALFAIAEQRDVSIKLCLFLDALDEHSGDKDQLAEMLHDVVKAAKAGRSVIKICVASRNWNVFEQHFGACPNLAIHNHTSHDIALFTRDSLLSVSGARGANVEDSMSDRLDRIASAVTSKARGVFIWVRLVVADLADGLRNGSPFFVLEQRLADIPQELEDLYRHTLERVDAKYAREGEVMLSLTMCAMSNMLLVTLDRCTSFTMWQRWDDLSERDMKRRLSSRTGGILEVVQSPFMFGGKVDLSPSNIVQPIHQTVKDFLRDNHDIGLKDEKGFAVSRTDGHLNLLRACTSCHDPWTDPIRPHMFDHAQIIEASGTKMQSDIFNVLNGQMHHLWKKHKYQANSKFTMVEQFEEYSSTLDLANDEDPRLNIVMAVAANLKSYVRLHVDRGLELTGTPCLLQIAALGPRLVYNKYDRVGMVRLLLESGYPPNYCTRSHFVVKYMSQPVDKYNNVVEVDVAISHFLVEASEVTPLFAILNLEYHPDLRDSEKSDIVRCLLSHGADPELGMRPFRDSQEDVWTPIDLCVYYGQSDLLELLLEYRGPSPQNPLLRTFTRMVAKYRRPDERNTRITPWVKSWLLSQPWRTFNRETWWPTPHDPNILPRPIATTLLMSTMPALLAGASVCPEIILAPTQAHMLANFERESDWLYKTSEMMPPDIGKGIDVKQRMIESMPVPTLAERLYILFMVWIWFVFLDKQTLQDLMHWEDLQRRKLRQTKTGRTEATQAMPAG